MDWIYFFVGSKQIRKGNILCVDEKFLIVANNAGSVIFLIYTFVTYSYAAIMLLVFYMLPKQSGLVMNLTMGGDDLMIHPNKRQPRTSSTVAQDKKAREMIRAMV